MSKRAVIIGGGLAGIAAGLRLADAGWAPVLLETRRNLGGRATSFPDRHGGELLDNCQHVLMGCCTALLDLYQRLGVTECIEWHEELFWWRSDGGRDRLRPGRLPAPLHAALSFQNMKLLDRPTKAQVRRGIWKLLRGGHRLRAAYRDRTFGEFLADTGQGPEAISLFWDTIIISACNLPSARVAAVHGMQVFQEAFLPGRWAGTMGLSTVPLADLYDPAEDLLRAAGGDLQLGCPVREICLEDHHAVGVMTGKSMERGDAVVSTIPPDRLAKLLPASARQRDRRLAHLESFEFSPILGVHVHWPRQVMTEPHLVLAGEPVHWIFNKGCDDAGRQHLHLVISAADDWMRCDEEEILARARAVTDRVLPDCIGLDPVSVKAVREKQATFAATADIEPRRPSAGPGTVGVHGGDITGLYVAGDWCDTGWPATMEGAVRSGYYAAAAITESDPGIEEVPAGPLAHWLGVDR